MIKNLFLKAINFYRIFISPNIFPHCRFYPSCSAYAQRAIQKYGIFRGLLKGIWRILRCNPFNKGGVDLP